MKLSKLNLISPKILGLALLTAVIPVPEAYAQENNSVNPTSILEQVQENNLGQVNRVSQLQDVAPGHWAYEALRNLIERYGCMRGYPDRTFRGNNPVNRYEFAATLSECLEKIEQFIANNNESGTRNSSPPAPRVNNADLRRIQRLTDEFAAELAILSLRVDELEEKVDFLEDHQFSTTTQLEGKVIFASIGAFGGDDDNETNITLGYRTRLNFLSSFSGEDSLIVRLQADGAIDPNIGSGQGDLFFAEAADDADGNVFLDSLAYNFPIGERTEVAIAANAGASDDFASTINFLDGDGNDGALTTFGSRHPIYYLIEQAGVGINHQFSDKFSLAAGYMAADPSDPSNGTGLFNGAYGAMGQLMYTPNEKLNIGLTYLNSYNTETGTGTDRSNLRTYAEDTFGKDLPISNNAYGIEFSWQVSDRFVLGGWGGYINSQALSSLDGDISRGSLDIWNWALTFGFPDLGKEGSLGGVIVGMEPKVTDSSIDNVAKDDDTTLHIEAFYQYQINDNIAITPGFVLLTHPDNSVTIGTVRTTFSF